jgi:hypothetical protein
MRNTSRYSEAENEEQEEDDDKGCRTKPLHLRLTAKGSFLDNVPVFPGDEKTETMLSQLFHFFGKHVSLLKILTKEMEQL